MSQFLLGSTPGQSILTSKDLVFLHMRSCKKDLSIRNKDLSYWPKPLRDWLANEICFKNVLGDLRANHLQRKLFRESDRNNTSTYHLSFGVDSKQCQQFVSRLRISILSMLTLLFRRESWQSALLRIDAHTSATTKVLTFFG